MIFSNRAENDMLNRRSTVLPKHIGYVIKIYNGKRYFRRLMKFEMIGFKFGDFTLNSKGGSNIHKTEKNKNKFK
jgi:ribosomal protein S19